MLQARNNARPGFVGLRGPTLDLEALVGPLDEPESTISDWAVGGGKVK